MSDKEFTKILAGTLSNAKELMDWGIDRGHTTADELRLTIDARKKKVKEYIDAGISQRQAAKLLGVSQATVRADLGPSGKHSKSEWKPLTNGNKGGGASGTSNSYEAEAPESIEDDMTEAEKFTHSRSALVILSGQAADLADMFCATMKGIPSSITGEAIAGVHRAARAWGGLAAQLEEDSNVKT